MYLIEDFDNKDFTKERRKHKGSFVDTMHAIMAQVYNDYLISQGDTAQKEILITSTVGYLAPPRRLEDVPIGNFWFPAVQPLKLTANFKESLASTKQVSKTFTGTDQSLGY